MRELPVRYRPEALEDLASIYRHILRKSRSRETAERFVQRIKARCDRIGRIPFAGRARDDLDPGIRTIPFERSAVVTYRVDDDHVRVTNVFNGGRDYEALYRYAQDGTDE